MKYKRGEQILYNNEEYTIIDVKKEKIGISKMYGLADFENLLECESIKLKYISLNDPTLKQLKTY